MMHCACQNNRANDVTTEMQIFSGRFEALLLCCIPLYKVDGILREFVEGISDYYLDHSSILRNDYIPRLLELEEYEPVRELCGKKISIAFDATPRMGNVFTLNVYFVCNDGLNASVNK
jgi:hypothetical protein